MLTRIPHDGGATPDSGTAPPPFGVSSRIGVAGAYVTAASPGLTTTRPFAKRRTNAPWSRRSPGGAGAGPRWGVYSGNHVTRIPSPKLTYVWAPLISRYEARSNMRALTSLTSGYDWQITILFRLTRPSARVSSSCQSAGARPVAKPSIITPAAFA